MLIVETTRAAVWSEELNKLAGKIVEGLATLSGARVCFKHRYFVVEDETVYWVMESTATLQDGRELYLVTVIDGHAKCNDYCRKKIAKLVADNWSEKNLPSFSLKLADRKLFVITNDLLLTDEIFMTIFY